MKAYFGSRISANQTKTPDGFLVAHNVPIARTGWYQYHASELGLDGDKVIDVYRDPDEVFSPSAMASFEGKPLTNNHPTEGVDPHNSSTYTKGVVTNVRRGKGDEEDLLLADLIAHDEQIIKDIESGKREVSAGYECDYEPNEDGSYSQKNIVGNHVALVDSGRAGDRVRIKDSRAPNLSAFRTPDELAQMIDYKDHNHLTDTEIKQALQDGGRFYVLSKVDPKSLKVQDEKNLQGVRDEFDQSKTPPIIVGKDGFVIDGRHRVASAKRCGVNLIDAYVPALKPQTANEGQSTKARDSRMSEIKLPSRKPGSVTRVLAAVGLKHYAMDAEPEDVMDAVDAMAEEHTQNSGNDFPVPTGQPGAGGAAKTDDDEGDQDAIAKLSAQVAQLTELVHKLAQPAPQEDPEQALDAEIERLSKEDKDDDDDESKTIEAQDDEGPVSDPEDRPQSALKAADSAAEFLKAMKPAIAAIKDPIEKKRVVDAALKAVKGRTARPSQTYQKLTKPAKTADTAQPAADPSELGKKIMAAHNPHYKNRV